jgi:hypothetical protein
MKDKEGWLSIQVAKAEAYHDYLQSIKGQQKRLRLH